MSALLILISISILVAAGFLVAYLWSVKNGQFEDDYTPSVRILYENEINKTEEEPKTETENNKTIN